MPGTRSSRSPRPHIAPRPGGEAAQPGDDTARPGGGTCWTVAPASPLSPGRRRAPGRGRALTSGAAPAERAGGGGARHDNTRGARPPYCACARPARRKQLGRAPASHGPPRGGGSSRGVTRHGSRGGGGRREVRARTAAHARPPGRGGAGGDVRRGTRGGGAARGGAGQRPLRPVNATGAPRAALGRIIRPQLPRRTSPRCLA